MKLIYSLFQEFLGGMKKKVKEPESLKMLKEAFKVFDSSGAGVVPREYMRGILQGLGGDWEKGDLDHMLDTLDREGEGSIRLEDFLRIVIETDMEMQEMEMEAETHWTCCIL